MKKKILSFFMLMIMLTFCACAVQTRLKEIDSEQLCEITIPESFIIFCGMDVKSMADAFEKYGEEYCTGVEIDGNNVVIVVTEEQRKNLIHMNKDYIDELVAPFLAQNSQYSFCVNEDYTKLSFSFDEKAEVASIKTVFETTMTYAMNNILLHNSPEWEIYIAIINCNNGNVVDEAVIPGGEIEVGMDEWEASYFD